MREIKFRVWQGETKSMERVNSLYTKWQDKRVLLLLPNGDDCIIMQYTGIKDKNEVEIFEGDILKNSPWLDKSKYDLHQVFWDEELAGFNLNTEGDIHLYVSDYAPVSEVIGNIWENPELLK